MSKIVRSVSALTRKVPFLADGLRKALPLSLKRKIGAALLPSNPEGTIASNDGREFAMIPDRLFLQVVYDGEFEPTLSNLMRSVIQPEDICVDVGSNFGWFATLMGMHSKKVFAYEPAGRARSILEENVALNKQGSIVTVRDVAVGNEAGVVQFIIEGDEARESALGYVGDAAPEEALTESTDLVRLDEDLKTWID